MLRILKLLGWAAGGLVALALAWTGALFVAARLVGVPEGMGVRNGRLAPCPPSPNCVSTQADPADQLHRLEPIPYEGPASATIARIAEIVAVEPRTEILTREVTYLHAVFRSPTMGFPDDVEFYVDEAAGLIHFRSASRLGYGDAGVNRSRMKRLGLALGYVAR